MFKPTPPRAETLMDKTTRVVRGIIDDDAQQRLIRTSRPRKARPEREAPTPDDTDAPTPSRARAKPRAKTTKKEAMPGFERFPAASVR